MSWTEGSPPEGDEQTVYKLQFRQDGGEIEEGNFSWSKVENTWVECIEGPDGIALYPEDGFEVIAWKGFEEDGESWLDKSPCNGCVCLDNDEMPMGEVMAPIQYCEIVTASDVFFASLYGEDICGEHKFLDCPHKQYA